MNEIVRLDVLPAREGAMPFTVRDIPSAYDEVRRKARRRHLSAGTLDGTAGLHEGLRALLSRKSEWNTREHFVGECIRAVWNAKLDYVRSRNVRNAAVASSVLAADASEAVAEVDRWSTLLDAFTDLERDESVKQRARIVLVMAYRTLVGLTLEETAREVGKSVSQVRLDQAFFEAWVQTWLAPEREAVEAGIEALEADRRVAGRERIGQVARLACLDGRPLREITETVGRPRPDVRRDLQFFFAWMERRDHDTRHR